MQTAEKLTFTFVFKLAALSALLFIGVMVKPANISKPATGAKNMTDFVVPATAAEGKDTSQIEQPYFKLVRYRLANSSSI